MLESLYNLFSFDGCGKRLKKITKALFWINFVLILAGWVILCLMLIIEGVDGAIWAVLFGWIPAAVEIVIVYIALLKQAAFGELVENSEILVGLGIDANRKPNSHTPVAVQPENPNPPKPEPKEEPVYAAKSVSRITPVAERPAKPAARPVIPDDGKPRCPTCGRLRKEGLSWCVGCGLRLPPEEKKQ